jgi:hypothetical protein
VRAAKLAGQKGLEGSCVWIRAAAWMRVLRGPWEQQKKVWYGTAEQLSWRGDREGRRRWGQVSQDLSAGAAGAVCAATDCLWALG